MTLAKAAAKAISQFAKAERKLVQVHQECGAVLARPFVSAGLHRFIESETDAAVAFERLAALLSDEKERTAFRTEVAKRAKSDAPKQRRRRVVKGGKNSVEATVAA